MKQEIIIKANNKLEFIYKYLEIVRGHPDIKLKGETNTEAFAVIIYGMAELAKTHNIKSLPELKELLCKRGWIVDISKYFKGTYSHFLVALHNLKKANLINEYNIPIPYPIIKPILSFSISSELVIKFELE
jgi:hypothetical protein